MNAAISLLFDDGAGEDAFMLTASSPEQLHTAQHFKNCSAITHTATSYGFYRVYVHVLVAHVAIISNL